MKKLFTTILLVPVIVSGCATLGFKPYKFTTVPVDKVKVEPVGVVLNQKFNNPNFYNKQEMSDYMTQCLIQNLAKVEMYNPDSDNTLIVDITYMRVYSGQTLGKSESITTPLLSYNYIVKNSMDDSLVLHSYTEEGLQHRETALKNAKSLFMMDNDNTSKSDEDKYLDALCDRITYKFLAINEVGKQKAARAVESK